MTRLDLRLATAADLEEFHGRPFEHTIRGYVAVLDGKVVAVAGVTYRCNVLTAFMELKDEARPYKVSIMRLAKANVAGLFNGLQGMAVADPKEPKSEKLLQWLGFQHVATCDEGEVYRWPGQE